jgi:hypothetical protein
MLNEFKKPIYKLDFYRSIIELVIVQFKEEHLSPEPIFQYQELSCALAYP